MPITFTFLGLPGLLVVNLVVTRQITEVKVQLELSLHLPARARTKANQEDAVQESSKWSVLGLLRFMPGLCNGLF